MIYYFAYGSNLHPLRLTQRVESANLVTSAQVFGYRLKFHKLGQDDSAKCNLLYTGGTSDSVFGAIYTLSTRHKSLLDEFEGKGSGYADYEIEIPHRGGMLRCFTYLAQSTHIVESIQPYDWYKQLVVQGADYLAFPKPYIRDIQAIKSLRDPDTAREQRHESLLQSIANYPALTYTPTTW